MAKTKKRKTKKSKKKTKTKTARRIRPKTVKKKKEATKKKQKQSTRQSIRQAAYTLCMSGSIIVLVAAILALIFPAMSFRSLETLTLFRRMLFASISLVSGIILLIATKKANRYPGVSGIIILVFSIVTLMLPPYGFIFGPLLSLIGSILLLIRR